MEIHFLHFLGVCILNLVNVKILCLFDVSNIKHFFLFRMKPEAGFF